MNGLWSFAFLGIPFFGKVHTVGHPAANNALVHLPVAEFHKESVDAGLAVAEFVDGDAFCLKRFEELVGNLFHVFLGIATNLAHLPHIPVKEVLLADQLV